MQEFWSTGVVTAKTRCWAQGMDGWRPLQAIPQLKWCLLATGQAVMNESDLATLILNMLITMCSYYPSRWAVFLGKKMFVYLDWCVWLLCPFSSGTRTMQLSVLYQRSRGWSVTMLVSRTLSRLMFYSDFLLLFLWEIFIPSPLQFVTYFMCLPTLAVVDFWPYPGGKGSKSALPGDAGQPKSAALVFNRSIFLHHDVHRLQCAACCKVKGHFDQLCYLKTQSINQKHTVNKCGLLFL